MVIGILIRSDIKIRSDEIYSKWNFIQVFRRPKQSMTCPLFHICYEGTNYIASKESYHDYAKGPMITSVFAFNLCKSVWYTVPVFDIFVKRCTFVKAID